MKPPFRYVTVRTSRAGVVHVYAGEHALLARMVRARAGVERIHPWCATVDAMRRKRLIRRAQCDHAVPVYVTTRLGERAVEVVANFLRERRLERAATAAAELDEQEAAHA